MGLQRGQVVLQPPPCCIRQTATAHSRINTGKAPENLIERLCTANEWLQQYLGNAANKCKHSQAAILDLTPAHHGVVEL
eukprot:scaffold507_cov391-Prasinococcus_capsulatus_cf.AAC.12